jgi:small subunit ribosomal protein S1
MKLPNQLDATFEDQVTPPDDTSFGDILSQFEQEHHDTPGQPLEGVVVAANEENFVVDIGRKTEGAIRKSDLQEPLNVGDKVLVNVLGRTQEGYYDLSTIKVERPKDWSGLQAAFAEGQVIGGTVLEVVKGGLRVDVGARAFMPASRSGARDIPDMEKLVGQQIRCKITKLDTEKEDIVVDRRAVLEEEERKAKAEAFGSVSEGQVRRGTVKTVMDFGAFVDVGGVDGLLHVTDMSWHRVNKPSDVLKPGDQIEVKILKVNPETRKISLGVKQLQPDPWAVAAGKYSVGDRIKGTVVRLTDFGAFIGLEAGVDGLIHISEMSWGKKVRKPSDVVTVGDSVEVVVLGVNPGEKRISLGLKQALGDPWADIEQRFPLGTTVEGSITNLTNFGAFVDLGAGIEGMIHVGDITRERRLDHPKDVLKQGQVVKAQVLEIDSDKRRIRLGMKQLEPTSMDHYIAEHQTGETVTGRIVDVKGERVKVELGDGVFGTCKIASEHKEETKSSKNTQSVDISSVTAMLAARWKQGGVTEVKENKNAVRSGQVRSFRIASVDAEQKKIQLDLVS